MKSKRISADEQFKLIMECRQSGHSDYQWCQMHDINPSTFYNWISRLHKRGTTIPVSTCQTKEFSSCPQEVVKVELVPESDLAPTKMEQNAHIVSNLTNASQPAVEILIGDTTIRFFNETEQSLVVTILKCLGGAIHAG